MPMLQISSIVSGKCNFFLIQVCFCGKIVWFYLFILMIFFVVFACHHIVDLCLIFDYFHIKVYSWTINLTFLFSISYRTHACSCSQRKGHATNETNPDANTAIRNVLHSELSEFMFRFSGKLGIPILMGNNSYDSTIYWKIEIE